MIVPTGAGGAIDAIARIFQRAFEKQALTRDKLVVVNLNGAGGTIGTRRLKDSPPDGYTIGLWHDGIVTSAAMGVVDFDHGAFEVLGATGYADIGLAVKADGPYKSFADLLAKAKAAPNTVTCATNIGLPVHFIPMMVAEAAGAEFRYVQVGGGAQRLASILGGHTDFALFSVLEFLKFAPQGLKGVVTFTQERVPEVKDIPAIAEHGLKVFMQSPRIWLAPKGTPADRLATLRALMKKAMADRQVGAELERLGLAPVWVEAPEVIAKLDESRDQVKPLVAKARALK